MNRLHLSRCIALPCVLLLALAGLTACSRAGSASAPAAAAIAPAPASSAQILVHKSPQCGCCSLWVEHMRAAGYTVDVRESSDLTALKQAMGVPLNAASCHTAEIGGY